MIVFIDESGVHKTDGHSCFALVYVATNNAELLERSIIEIERRNRMTAFHWTDQPWIGIRNKITTQLVGGQTDR